MENPQGWEAQGHESGSVQKAGKILSTSGRKLVTGIRCLQRGWLAGGAAPNSTAVMTPGCHRTDPLGGCHTQEGRESERDHGVKDTHSELQSQGESPHGCPAPETPTELEPGRQHPDILVGREGTGHRDRASISPHLLNLL